MYPEGVRNMKDYCLEIDPSSLKRLQLSSRIGNYDRCNKCNILVKILKEKFKKGYLDFIFSLPFLLMFEYYLIK